MRIRLAFTVSLSLLATSGCFFHGGNPYGYYGPGPGVVPQQPSTGYPSPFYQPGNTYTAPMNTGPVYVPQNSPAGPTLTNPGLNPTYESPSGGSPGFNPDTPSGGGTPVPRPDDDRGAQVPTNLTPTSSTSSSYEPDETPFKQDETRLPPRSRYDSDTSFAEEEASFEPPVMQTSGSNDDDGNVEHAVVHSQSKTNLYGHHPDFEWVQGTVEYNQKQKTWSIMYDDHPQDQFGGDLTLARHPEITPKLRDGALVRVYGSIDEAKVDARGKPVYRMTRLN